MTKQEFIKTGLCEQYVLKLTSEEENELVEQMLERYPELVTDCMRLGDCVDRYISSQKTLNTPKKNFLERFLEKLGL